MDKIPTNSIPLLLIFSHIIHAISAATDTIDASQTIRDGQTLVSSRGIFQFGFFSPGNSKNRYLGIWYNNITPPTYVWVANRGVAIPTKTGVLRFTELGNLALFNDTNGTIVWSNGAPKSRGSPALQLLDSGNLVVQDTESGSFIWQSFDYPTDIYLPGMTSLGWNLATGVVTNLSSWRSEDDPAPGDYTIQMDPTGYPQCVTRQRDRILNRIGPWIGEGFSVAAFKPTNHQAFVMNGSEGYYMDDIVDSSAQSMLVLTPGGIMLRLILDQRSRSWTLYATMPSDTCDSYNLCGAYGRCDVGNNPHCRCLEGFVPKDVDISGGCVRRIPLSCREDVFLKYSGIKLPDARNVTIDERRTSIEECEEDCSRNCTCVAYTQLNVSGSGSGCLFYHEDLIDIRVVAQDGQDLYIRMASAEREQIVSSTASRGKKRVLILSLTIVGVCIILCLCLGLFILRKRKKMKGVDDRPNGTPNGIHGEEADVPLFSLHTILKATDHFSADNKIGEGGFGPVYKGVMEDGQEIAVKRLSETSSQGVEELKNEVMLIAKLQHRNLVRLLGCCIQGEENMLIYEFMPNSSLDLILFDQTTRALLDWGVCFNIINGIAKGLLYLHQDSRLTIIHRDLKASNILLDANMNPKISDFGMARSFGGNETEAKTRRVVGTYGYMPPEYVMKGLFSTKSDVFSFGVLVLEVVSGKRNRDFSLKDKCLNLIGHAWTLYKEESLRELVEASLVDSFDISQASRVIHVGLLCVQASPEDRPNMSSVVFMLGNEVELPEAKSPAFFTERDVSVVGSFVERNNASSANQVTISLLDGR